MVTPFNPYAKKPKSKASHPPQTTRKPARTAIGRTNDADLSQMTYVSEIVRSTQCETQAPALPTKFQESVSSSSKPIELLSKSDVSQACYIGLPGKKPLSLKAKLKQDIEKLKRETQLKQLMMEERKRRKNLERKQREDDMKSKQFVESSENFKQPSKAVTKEFQNLRRVEASNVQMTPKSTGSNQAYNENSAIPNNLEEKVQEISSFGLKAPLDEAVVGPATRPSHSACSESTNIPLEGPPEEGNHLSEASSALSKNEELIVQPSSTKDSVLDPSNLIALPTKPTHSRPRSDHGATELSPQGKNSQSVEVGETQFRPNPPPVDNHPFLHAAPSVNLTAQMGRQLMLAQQYWHHQQMALHSTYGFCYPYWAPPGGPYFGSLLPPLSVPMAASGPPQQFQVYGKYRATIPPHTTMTYPAQHVLGSKVEATHKIRRSYNKTAGARRLQESRASFSNKLATHPLVVPSPFAATHEALSAPIVILKPAGELSFGVTVKLDVQTALVSREWLEENNFVASESVAEVDSKQTIVPQSLPQPVLEEDSVAGKKDAASNLQNASVGLSVPPCRSASTIDTESTLIMDSARKPQRRRKRWPFAAIAVQDASIQNVRNPGVPADQCLKAGDLLLEINGQKTAGLTFQQAVDLLKNFKVTDTDGVARCPVVVARRKVQDAKKQTPGPSKSLPLAKPALATDEEICRFAFCLIKSTADSKRVLGRELSDESILSHIGIESCLSSLNFQDMIKAWKARKGPFENDLTDKAAEHWKVLWANEPAASQVPGVDYITDAQRAALRALPQPANGCRCGATDHRSVIDEKCPLYSNLRSLAPDKLSRSSVDNTATSIGSKLPKDLNVVERAFTDRFVKLKDEQKARENESRFVADAEEVQLKQCKQALAAPSLEAMVLSTVAELEEEMRAMDFHQVENTQAGSDSQVKASIGASPSSTMKNQNLMASHPDESVCHDDSDEDDDVPLAALGKRAGTLDGSAVKRQKLENSIRFYFLARLLKAISVKWGHVYREPADEEHAWRWEVYHGQALEEGSQWESTFKNPRKPGSLTLENIRFGIDDDFPREIEGAAVGDAQSAASLKALAYLVSPDTSGIVDELLALVSMNVLETDDKGIPRLTEDWWAHADLLLLEDLNDHWGEKADPRGRFGISETIRVTLREKWRRTRDGWVLVDYPDELVYDFDEFDLWREAFEQKQQEYQDDDEGIGRFGI